MAPAKEKTYRVDKIQNLLKDSNVKVNLLFYKKFNGALTEDLEKDGICPLYLSKYLLKGIFFIESAEIRLHQHLFSQLSHFFIKI